MPNQLHRRPTPGPPYAALQSAGVLGVIFKSMKDVFEIEVNEQMYSLHISEKPTHWANGVLVEVFDDKGNSVNSISYASHPEFDDFKLYKNMTKPELTQVVLGRIKTDISSRDFKLAAENGMKLLLPLNRKT